MAPLSDVSIVELKTCPRCEESLPLSEFGICRARKDGLNLYCKRCIRQKIALSRAALREYKNARVKHGASSTDRSRLAIDAAGFSPRRIARMLRKLSPADRVREAIRCGARTQKQIAHLHALRQRVRQQHGLPPLEVHEPERAYSVAPVANKAKRKRGGSELNSSFSSVGVLMPGRKPSARGKKRSLRAHPGGKTRLEGPG